MIDEETFGIIDKETFGIPIYKKKIINSKNDMQFYINNCKKLVEKYDEGWGYGWAGFCGSWNSNFLTENLLLDLTAFSGLRQVIIDCSKEYLKILKMPSDYRMVLKDSWVNATGKYGFQEYHRHPPSTISGCIYFSSPKEYGNFYFKNPFAYDLHNELEIFEGRKFIDLDAGDILLFPSNLEHGVMQNPTNKNRYSLCFNWNTI